MRNRVILLCLLLFTVAAAMPAEAKPSECSQKPGSAECSNGGDIEEYCAKHPDAKKCARAVVEDICNVVVVHTTTAPQLGVWDPLLGIVEFNPEDCYEYYVEVENSEPEYMFTYDQGQIYR